MRTIQLTNEQATALVKLLHIIQRMIKTVFGSDVGNEETELTELISTIQKQLDMS